MHTNIVAPRFDQSVYNHLRLAELIHLPRALRADEAREIVQLAHWVGQRCEPPIIDEDPHPDGIPENPIYSRGAR